MSKKILYLQENGKVAMMSLASEMNIDDFIPKNTNYILLDESELPDEQTLIEYFEALTINFSRSASSV